MATAKSKKASKKSAPVKKKSVAKKVAVKAAPKKKVAAAKSGASKRVAPAGKPGAKRPPAKTKGMDINWTEMFQPLDDRIVVLREDVPETSPGGLILVSNNEASFLKATVVAVGVGKRNKKGLLRPLDVQVGDVVLLNSFAGSKVTVGSQEAMILRETDVLGVVTA